MRLPGARGEVWTERGGGKRPVDWALTAGPLVRIDTATRSAGEVPRLPSSASGVWASRLPERRAAATSGPASAPRPGRARRPPRRARLASARRAGSRTSRPAITRATRSGAGRPASARTPTAARSAGTSSRESTTRRSAPSGRSGSTASPREPGPVELRRPRRRSSFEDGSRLDFAAEAERARSENLLVVKYSYRQPFGTLQRIAAGRDRARAGHRRHGAPGRPLVMSAAAAGGSRRRWLTNDGGWPGIPASNRSARRPIVEPQLAADDEARDRSSRRGSRPASRRRHDSRGRCARRRRRRHRRRSDLAGVDAGRELETHRLRIGDQRERRSARHARAP